MRFAVRVASSIVALSALTFFCGSINGLVAAASRGHETASMASNLPTFLAPLPAPPTGFNPLQATAAQLAHYGFPPRPTDPTALATWTQAMQDALHYVVPDQVPSTSIHSPDYNYNWAGYVATSSNNGGQQFVGAQASWVQPYWPGGSGSTADPSFWVGVGGQSSSCQDIVQAGADSGATNAGGSTHYEFWVEDAPKGTLWQLTPSVGPNDTVYVSVFYNGPNNSSEAFLENETTSTYTAVPFSAPDYTGCSADFINEDVGAPTAGYADYGTTTFSGAYVFPANGNNDGDFYKFSLTEDIMTNTGTSSGTVESVPGPIDTGTSGFGVGASL